MIGTIHKLDKILLPSSVEFGGIKNAHWTAGIESFKEGRPAGALFNMFRCNKVQKPAFSFSTTQLDVLLTNVPVNGLSVLQGAGGITTYLKLAGYVSNTNRATTSHQKIAIPNSVIYWSDIHLSDKETGEAKVTIASFWDGTNDPFIYTGSVALSGSLAVGNFFGAGPVYVNSVAIPGIQDITIASECKIVQLGDQSEEFPTFVMVQELDPSITIKTYEAVNWATYGLRGTALDGANGIVCYGRKYANYNSRVANGTAQHIKFQGLNGTCIPITTDGDKNNPTTDTLKIELVATAAETSPLTISTTSTIT